MSYFESLDELDFLANIRLANRIVEEERRAMEAAQRGASYG